MSYFEQTKVTDSTGTVINPSSDESVQLLRRIVKLLESSAVTDANQRQRVAVESVTGTSLGSSIGATTVNVPTAGAPVQSGSTTYWQQVWTGPVDQRYQIMDAARNMYATCIRPNLTFS